MRQVDHRYLLPHEWFATMYEDYQTSFGNVLLGGTTDSPRAFWDAVATSTQFQSHPVSQEQSLDTMIPLGLHGDGVPCTGVSRSWSQGVDAWSISSLLVKGPTVKYLTCLTLLWQEAVNDKTLESFWNTMSWSFSWLQKGLWPRADQHGKARGERAQNI